MWRWKFRFYNFTNLTIVTPWFIVIAIVDGPYYSAYCYEDSLFIGLLPNWKAVKEDEALKFKYERKWLFRRESEERRYAMR